MENQCPKCNKFLAPDNSTLSVGDEVSFVEISGSTRCMRFSERVGTITEINGDALTIKVKRRGFYHMWRKDVTLKGNPVLLNNVLGGTCTCSQETVAPC